ncbi:MAG: ABC transporter substrate-binding protein [Actinobacteria bacterium]|nr:MAG: ABC transporter substrate-binding protein [Actinomycetota bacterium]
MTLIRVAHSPDSDDAFMFYALAERLIDTGELEFEHVLRDIETLNQAAFEGRYEITAVSIHAYAYLDEGYALLSSGASMGEGYGPLVVARRPLDEVELAGVEVAVPGALTSAALALRLWNPALRTVVRPFDEIVPAVVAGELAAGVVIHEGQLTWRDEGLHALVDLGAWWGEQTGGLPLPLGGNVVRRDLGDEMVRRLARLLRQAVEYALANREAALDHSLRYARGLDRATADRFVGMYVNQRTVDYGERGREAVRLFLDRAHRAGLIPRVPRLDFVAG